MIILLAFATYITLISGSSSEFLSSMRVFFNMSVDQIPGIEGKKELSPVLNKRLVVISAIIKPSNHTKF